MSWPASLSFLALTATACTSSGVGTTGACDGSADCAFSCSPDVDTPPFEGRTHVPVGTTVNYIANPPASGNHWPVWQEPWDVYPNGVPREEWVHNLEHGGIVLLYNCPSGCADVLDALTNIRLSQPPDQYNVIRVLVVPDALMPRKVAAVAWGWRWQGDTVDAAAIQCFIDARYDRGPESLP